MKMLIASRRTRLLIVVSLLLLLALTLTAYGSGSTVQSLRASAEFMPGMRSGPQPCPAAVKATTRWDSLIGTHGEGKVESVSCGNLLGNASLQALVTVRHAGTDNILDVYVYDKITSDHPQQLFKLQRLTMGDARISTINTVITAEVAKESSVNKGKPPAQWARDFCREFQWSARTKTFEQVSFPSFFPDLTRYQAENDQAQVYRGKDAWKFNAVQTALHFATDMLKWSIKTGVTVEVSGGPLDLDAMVSMKNASPGNGTSRLVLHRFDENASGIWEVAVAQTSLNMFIRAPSKGDRIISPVAVDGEGTATEGVVGTVYVLDHLYTDIGHKVVQVSGNGQVSFVVDVPYHSSIPHGEYEEGIVALYSLSSADGSIAQEVMVKVLIGG